MISSPPVMQYNAITDGGCDPTGATSCGDAASALCTTANAAYVSTGVQQTIYWPPGTYLFLTKLAYAGESWSTLSGVSHYLAGAATWLLPYIDVGASGGYCIGMVADNVTSAYVLGPGTIKGSNPSSVLEVNHWGLFWSGTSSRYGVLGLYSPAGGPTFLGFQGKATQDQATGSHVTYQGLTFGQGGAGNAIGLDGLYTDLTVARIRIAAAFAGFDTQPGESIISSNNTGSSTRETWEDIVSTGWTNLNISGTTLVGCTFSYCSFAIVQGCNGDAGGMNVDGTTLTGCTFTNCVFDASATTVGADSRGMGNSPGAAVWANNTFHNCVFKSKTGQQYSLYVSANASSSGNVIDNSANCVPSGTAAMFVSPSGGFTLS